MKEIKLTKGKVTIVDDEDYDALSVFFWHFDARGYAARSCSIGNSKWRKRRLHRELLGITDPNIQVDHINGNRLDNRRCNLRLCSTAENTRNRGKPKSNTSGYKGVITKRNRWYARIKLDTKYYSLGGFSTAEAAHEAYKAAAIKMHGEFANYGQIEHAAGKEPKGDGND